MLWLLPFLLMTTQISCHTWPHRARAPAPCDRTSLAENKLASLLFIEGTNFQHCIWRCHSAGRNENIFAAAAYFIIPSRRRNELQSVDGGRTVLRAKLTRFFSVATPPLLWGHSHMTSAIFLIFRHRATRASP